MEMKERKVVAAIQDLLFAIFGEDWIVDPNLKGTPERVMRAYREILEYQDTEKMEKAFLKCLSVFPSNFNGMIFTPNITANSMCPHHLLPVSYDITIAYIPNLKNKIVLGASKPERIARIFAAKAVLQEDLTKNIADFFMKTIKVEGVAVVTSGKHECMRCRGIKTKGTLELSLMEGSFKTNPETRNEFFSLMNLAELRRK